VALFPDLTVEYTGFVNGTAALDHLTAAFPGRPPGSS